jgi:PAS domain S-box-containing protein
MEQLFDACSRSERLISAIISCVRHVIAVVDEEGRILLVNDEVEKVFGLTREDLANKELSVFFGPEDLTHLYPNLLYMAKKGKDFEGELTLVRKDGTRFFAYIVFRPFMGLEPSRAVAVACIHDIDRQKKQRKSFRESHYDDLVKIADGIAHEMRNPLVIIGGSAKRLYASCHENNDHEKYYDGIRSNVSRLEGLVQKVEFFANLPAPCLQRHSMRTLMDEALQQYRQQMERHRIAFTNTVEHTDLYVDRDLVVRAFSILLDNAFDALPEGGELMVHSEVTSNACMVYVTDKGQGISAEDLPHIFKPFYRTKPHGIGIDLAVVRQILHSHDGDIDVASQPGKGTTFSLTFPIERRRPIRVCHMGHPGT